MGEQSAQQRDDGTRNIPGEDTPWEAWVSASSTRNFCNGDPVLDWLDDYGPTKGFRPDTEFPEYDDRTDFLKFVFKGTEFEATVVNYLRSRVRFQQVAYLPRDARDRAAVETTLEAMRAGTEIIGQAVLWNPESQTYGLPDLLVRSDVLLRLFPGLFAPEEAVIPAPDLPGSKWHYRVVDIKFTTLHLLKSGHAASDHTDFMVQVWLYSQALGRLQGLVPSAGYLLGRGWEQLGARGRSALERVERIDRDYVFGQGGGDLRGLALSACAWIRRMQKEGAAWEVLPKPSVDELRPNMRNSEDAPWHRAKQRIADELQDLTLIYRVSPRGRAAARSAGLSRWTDPKCSAEQCGVSGPSYTRLVNAVIRANQSPSDGPVVFPERVAASEDLWRRPIPAEFYVDFETVNDLNDDFSTFPHKGGLPLIFMIGCGCLEDPQNAKSWTFRVFTANRLTESEEERIVTEWLSYVDSVCAARGSSLKTTRLFHWSPAETSTLTNAYNAAAVRHDFPPWDGLPWIDLLTQVIRTEPVTVRGAFGFGLKAVAKAMHRARLIETEWGDGPTDGLGAMVGAWWCDTEAARRSVSLQELDLMRDIQAYNEVDCRVMAEVLFFLRAKR